MLTICAVALLLAAPATPEASAAAGAGRRLPYVSAEGKDLVAGGKPFKAFGFNYTYALSHPNILYFESPTARRLQRIQRDFRKAAAAGANTMRIYLELPTFMLSPRRPRKAAFDALRRVIAEAERTGLYLDITGNLTWHTSPTWTWYEELDEAKRWAVQARFWRQVARVGASSPSVLVYELTSEPTVCEVAPPWYSGYYFGHWYAQCIVRHNPAGGDGRDARRWVGQLARSIRREDTRHLISVGLLPLHDDPFGCNNLFDLVDVMIVHEYPEAGRAEASTDVARRFARFDRPVLLGETFSADPETLERFVDGSAPFLDGMMSFFDGRLPQDVHGAELSDAFYSVNLTSYLGLQDALNPPASDEREGPPLTASGPPLRNP